MFRTSSAADPGRELNPICIAKSKCHLILFLSNYLWNLLGNYKHTGSLFEVNLTLRYFYGGIKNIPKLKYR